MLNSFFDFDTVMTGISRPRAVACSSVFQYGCLDNARIFPDGLRYLTNAIFCTSVSEGLEHVLSGVHVATTSRADILMNLSIF